MAGWKPESYIILENKCVFSFFLFPATSCFSNPQMIEVFAFCRPVAVGRSLLWQRSPYIILLCNTCTFFFLNNKTCNKFSHQQSLNGTGFGLFKQSLDKSCGWKKMWFWENINQIFWWRLVINKIDRCSTLIPWWQKKL